MIRRTAHVAAERVKDAAAVTLTVSPLLLLWGLLFGWEVPAAMVGVVVVIFAVFAGYAAAVAAVMTPWWLAGASSGLWRARRLGDRSRDAG